MSKTIYHNHHITPRCLLEHKPKSFVDNSSNIARVTLYQHIALHKWLFMLTGEISCELAYQAMATGFWYDIGGYSNKGIKRSEDTKQKMSKAKKKSWKYYPEETKKIMRANLDKTGIPMADETKSKIGNSNRGKQRSKEQKQRMSVAKQGNTYKKGTKLSPEAKQRISEGMRSARAKRLVSQIS